MATMDTPIRSANEAGLSSFLKTKSTVNSAMGSRVKALGYKQAVNKATKITGVDEYSSHSLNHVSIVA